MYSLYNPCMIYSLVLYEAPVRETGAMAETSIVMVTFATVGIATAVGQYQTLCLDRA